MGLVVRENGRPADCDLGIRYGAGPLHAQTDLTALADRLIGAGLLERHPAALHPAEAAAGGRTHDVDQGAVQQPFELDGVGGRAAGFFLTEQALKAWCAILIREQVGDVFFAVALRFVVRWLDHHDLRRLPVAPVLDKTNFDCFAPADPGALHADFTLHRGMGKPMKPVPLVWPCMPFAAAGGVAGYVPIALGVFQSADDRPGPEKFCNLAGHLPLVTADHSSSGSSS